MVIYKYIYKFSVAVMQNIVVIWIFVEFQSLYFSSVDRSLWMNDPSDPFLWVNLLLASNRVEDR